MRAFTLALLALSGATVAAAQPPFLALTPDGTPRSVVVRRAPVATGPAAPLPPDRWIAYDKAQHFLASGLLVLAGQYVLETKGGAGRSAALPLSVGAAAGVGLAKESFDLRRPGGTGFSKKDLVADAAGIAAALVVILW